MFNQRYKQNFLGELTNPSYKKYSFLTCKNTLSKITSAKLLVRESKQNKILERESVCEKYEMKYDSRCFGMREETSINRLWINERK